MWGSLAAIIGLLLISTKQTLSYSSVCPRCLATRSGQERSIIGIPYESKYEPIQYLYNTAEGARLAKFSDGRQTIAEQIYGKACEHEFVRTGFCRYRNGSVGCGGFGGSLDVRCRVELVLGAFKAFERIRNQELAARSCILIEREFSLVRPPRTGGQNLIKDAEEQAERYRRMFQLGELLGLVRNKEDWAMVLEYGNGGFQGDPPLLSAMQVLSERVAAGEIAAEVTAASLLTQRSATSDSLVARLISQGSSEVAGTVKSVVIWKKRLELFGMALEGYELSEQHKIIIRRYSAEDFLRLLALEDKNVDEMCAENIWYTDHFVLLDPMLAALNRNGSQQARDTIGKLLRGGNPYNRGGIPETGSGGYDPEYMWDRIKIMGSTEERMRETIRTNLQGASSGLHMNFYEAVRGIGATNDQTQWSFLRDSYLQSANVWALAVLGRAMHQLDARATESFLIDEMHKGARYPAVISAMGFIGSGKFAPVLEEFAARPRSKRRLEGHLPKNYYDAEGDGTALLTYALHRCHGIPSWKLVKNAEGRYLIEKPSEISR